MSTYISLYSFNVLCSIYNTKSKETKNIWDGQVDNYLEELTNQKPVAKIKRIVVFGRSETPDFDVIEEFRSKGVRKVHIINDNAIELQEIVNDTNLLLKRREYFLYSFFNGTTLWQCVGGKLIFQRTLFRGYGPDFVSSVQTVINERKIQKWYCTRSCIKIIKKYFADLDQIQIKSGKIHICRFQYKNLASAALWMAKRMDRVERGGYLVQNFYEDGPQVFFDDKCVFDKSKEGVPMPFKWTSEWGVKAESVTLKFWNVEEKIVLPKNKTIRVVLKIDENGKPEFNFELQGTVCRIWRCILSLRALLKRWRILC